MNCVDRHAENDPDRVALLWERDEPGQHVKVTYAELADKVRTKGKIQMKRAVLPTNIASVDLVMGCPNARAGVEM